MLEFMISSILPRLHTCIYLILFEILISHYSCAYMNFFCHVSAKVLADSHQRMSTLKNPNSGEAEKGVPAPHNTISNNIRDCNLALSAVTPSLAPRTSRFGKFVPPDLLESRGIERVLPFERHPLTWYSYLQAFVLWVSINLAAVNITLGMLASTVFGLGFMDASLCAVFGSALGSCAVSYIATWGPKGGVRTMVSPPSLQEGRPRCTQN